MANTWLNMKSMIGSFLSSVWKQGGLAGAVPEDTFAVQVGLGETMTQDDVLNGIMRITVLYHRPNNRHYSDYDDEYPM